MPTEDSIEPSYAILREVIQGYGFQLEVNIRHNFKLAHKKRKIQEISVHTMP